MTRKKDMAIIEIACDTPYQISFMNWLNRQGYDASIGTTTGNYINGIHTATDEAANEDMRRLWDDFCGEEL